MATFIIKQTLFCVHPAKLITPQKKVAKWNREIFFNAWKLIVVWTSLCGVKGGNKFQELSDQGSITGLEQLLDLELSSNNLSPISSSQIQGWISLWPLDQLESASQFFQLGLMVGQIPCQYGKTELCNWLQDTTSVEGIALMKERVRVVNGLHQNSSWGNPQ